MLSPTQHTLLISYKEIIVQKKQEMFQKRLSDAIKEHNEQVSNTCTCTSITCANSAYTCTVKYVHVYVHVHFYSWIIPVSCKLIPVNFFVIKLLAEY